MLKSYLTIACRDLRYKIHSFTTIPGLAIGMASSLQFVRVCQKVDAWARALASTWSRK
jgi:hypothetical protein